MKDVYINGRIQVTQYAYSKAAACQHLQRKNAAASDTLPCSNQSASRYLCTGVENTPPI